ncbi:GNAT family N-acetyltransferase [Litoreibacter sp.]|nr:GNAT family N-acetyltransferase [Litoreibacter sp.]
MLPSPMRLEKGRYVARIAEGAADLQAVQSLRCQVFRGACAGDGTSDEDRFDTSSTHVLVEEVGIGRLVCCFRMLTFDSGALANTGYSAQFYDLSTLADYAGPLVEIGRFCVAPGEHDGDILRVAWGAVTAHVDALGVTMLFGCSSFDGTSEVPHLDTLALLKDKFLAPQRWMPKVKARSVFPYAQALIGRTPDRRLAVKGMPPLLRTYLAMGGWVSDHAVIDLDLGTLHVFTGVEIASIPPARARALRSVAS